MKKLLCLLVLGGFLTTGFSYAQFVLNIKNSSSSPQTFIKLKIEKFYSVRDETISNFETIKNTHNLTSFKGIMLKELELACADSLIYVDCNKEVEVESNEEFFLLDAKAMDSREYEFDFFIFNKSSAATISDDKLFCAVDISNDRELTRYTLHLDSVAIRARISERKNIGMFSRSV